MLLVTLLAAMLPPDRIGCDFFSFWAAGELLATGQNPYDPGLQAQIQRAHGWDKEIHGRQLYDFMPYYYPPWLGLAVTALVPLGYPAAKIAWVARDFELLLVTGFLLRKSAPGLAGWGPVLCVTAFVFFLFSTLMGQTVPLVLFLINASWLLLERRKDRRAGGLLVR
jgi:hypothetical protein